MKKQKTYKCSEVHDTCLWGGTCGGEKCCDYYFVKGVGNRRGCPPEKCTKYKKGDGRPRIVRPLAI